MYPTIRDGEVVTVAPVQARDVGRGDVLLYLTERGLTAHRVLRRLPGEETAFRVRGDAPGSEEELVVGTQVLGRVESVERAGRELPVGGFLRIQVRALVQLAQRVLALARGLRGI